MPSRLPMGGGLYRGKIALHRLGGSRQRPTRSRASSTSGEWSRCCLPVLRRIRPIERLRRAERETDECPVAESVQNLQTPTVSIPMTGRDGARHDFLVLPERRQDRQDAYRNKTPWLPKTAGVPAWRVCLPMGKAPVTTGACRDCRGMAISRARWTDWGPARYACQAPACRPRA